MDRHYQLESESLIPRAACGYWTARISHPIVLVDNLDDVTCRVCVEVVETMRVGAAQRARRARRRAALRWLNPLPCAAVTGR